MSRKIRLAIIGLDHWYWALGCAYNISMDPNTELLDIADPNMEQANNIATIYGARKFSTDYHSLLDNPEVDGVIITTVTSMHHQVAVEAAKAGKHILIGKPIARNLRDAREILDAAKKHNVKLLPMASGVLPGDYVMKLLNEGQIGEPFAAHCSMLAIPPLRSPGVNEPGWFADPTQSPGGAFVDHGIYDIALLRKYFRSEIRSVFATLGKFKHKELAVEDHGVAILSFDNGSIGTIESSWTSVTQSHSRKIIIGTTGEIEIRRNMLSNGSSMISIWGTKQPDGQRVLIETQPPEPVFMKNYVEKSIPMPPFAMNYRPTVLEFINCILEDRQPSLTGEDAYKVLEACLAAYKSHDIGEPVTLPLTTDVDVVRILSKLG